METSTGPGHHSVDDLKCGSVMTLTAADCVCEQGLCSAHAGGASGCSARRGQNTLLVGGRGVCLSGGPGSGSDVHSTHSFGAWSLWTLLLWGHLC